MARRYWVMLAVVTAVTAVVLFVVLLYRPFQRTSFRPSQLQIRVWLGGFVAEATVAAPCPVTVRAVDSAEPLALLAELPPTTIRATATGVALGEQSWPAARLELWPAQDGALRIGDRAYRGYLRVLKRADGKIALVNVLGLERYLASVINSEMPARWPTAARTAQAISARTYALIAMKTSPERFYDVFDDTASQMYRGVESESESSRQIIEESRGIVLAYQGRVFRAYYGSTCGGETAAVDELFQDPLIPPLAGSVPCSYCSRAPNHRWTVTLQKQNLPKKLGQTTIARAADVQQVTAVEVIRRPGRQLPAGVRFVTDVGEIELSVNDFRRKIIGAERARSQRFDIIDRAEVIVVEGQGWGHGVGLCQYGARTLALQNRSAEEILQFYYPQSELVAVY